MWVEIEGEKQRWKTCEYRLQHWMLIKEKFKCEWIVCTKKIKTQNKKKTKKQTLRARRDKETLLEGLLLLTRGTKRDRIEIRVEE